MKYDLNKYVMDSSGLIYKQIETHYLNLSPCDPREKYVTMINMENRDCHLISYNNACMIVNKQYNSIDESWNFEGKTYLARMLNIVGKDDIEVHTQRIRLLPDHRIVLDDEGESELKMVKHKGKLYYILLINERLPRVKAYDLFGKFCQWVGIQYCKPIFCPDDDEFI